MHLGLFPAPVSSRTVQSTRFRVNKTEWVAQRSWEFPHWGLSQLNTSYTPTDSVLCVWMRPCMRAGGYLCVGVYVAGGFRLKYAASHISEALDNAEWRRGTEEDFSWSRFHSNSPLFVPRHCMWAVHWSVWVLRGKKKQKNILKKKVCPAKGAVDKA